MKKQLLVLLSSMLLLSGCGIDNSTSSASSVSSDTGSSETTPTTPSLPAEPAKIDVTFKVTASGIDEYSGSHSILYINSNFEGSDWTTHAMSQDEENKNIWTYTFNEVEVDARYNYNIVYGSEDKVDWANGFNTEGNGEEPRVIKIEEDKSLYEIDATFVIPTVKHSFTLKLTPHVQTTKGSDDTMYDSTYVWMYCSVENQAALEKQSDGTWTYEVTDYVGTVFEYTPCLGSQSAINWSYQYGQYKDDGQWEQWNGTKLTLVEGTTEYTADVYFCKQPDEITGDTYSITWHYLATDTSNIIVSNGIKVVYKVNGTTVEPWPSMWEDNTDTTKYNYTLKADNIPSGATVTYHLYNWRASGDERYLYSDTSWTDFEITNVTSDLEYIITGDFGATAGTCGQGTATKVEG